MKPHVRLLVSLVVCHNFLEREFYLFASIGSLVFLISFLTNSIGDLGMEGDSLDRLLFSLDRLLFSSLRPPVTD